MGGRQDRARRQHDAAADAAARIQHHQRSSRPPARLATADHGLGRPGRGQMRRASEAVRRSDVRRASRAPPSREALDSASAARIEPDNRSDHDAACPDAAGRSSRSRSPKPRMFLRLDQTDEDELLGTLITAARLMVEAASGRMLVEQAWRIVLDRWPRWRRDPAAALACSAVIAAARVYDALGAAQTVAPSWRCSSIALPIRRSSGSSGRCPRSAGARRDRDRPRRRLRRDGDGTCRRCCARPCCGWPRAGSSSAAMSSAAMPRRLPAEIMALIAPFRRARL